MSLLPLDAEAQLLLKGGDVASSSSSYCNIPNHQTNHCHPPVNDNASSIHTTDDSVDDDRDLVDDFWKMAHVATCLHQSTLASSCAVVQKMVTTTTTTTATTNPHMGGEEVPTPAGAVDVNAVCGILGNDMDICAYIRLDGSIANNNNSSSEKNNNNINTNILNRKNQCCYYTTAAMECNGNGTTPSLSNNNSSDGERSSGAGRRQYYYYNRGEKGNAELLSMLSEMNQQQLEQLSQLSGMYLTDKLLLRGKGRAGRRGQRMVDATSTNISTEATASPYSSTTALASNVAVAIFQTLKSGATRVMNGVLSVIEGAEANDAYFDAIASDSGNSGSAATLVDESSSLQVRKLLTKDVASGAIVAAASSGENALFDNGDNVDDTAALLGRTSRTNRYGETLNNTNLSSVLPPINSEDMLISIPVVAYTCRHLLTFAQSVVSSRSGISEGGGVGKDDDIDFRRGDYTAFFVPMTRDGDGASAARIILYRDGWDTCSFGMFCRKAGSYFASSMNGRDNSAPSLSATMTEPQTLSQYGKLLLNMSREEIDLLARTLCKSNFATVENDLFILFPGGIPADTYSHHYSSLVEAAATTTPPTFLSSSDSALFQIHVTKISIQNKMTRLERDANVAKNNAIQARRDNKDTTNELALVYMRRRKAALDELERCSSMLSNLDACELRLERAREDVQLVQSYTYFRTAMQDVRKSRDEVLRIGSSTSNSYEDVEELMLDIREEMDEMNEMNSQMNKMMTIDHYNEIDEEELNEEFRRLELECESANQEQSFPKVLVEDDSALVKKAQLDPPLMTTTGLQKEESSSPETLIEPAY